MSEEGWPADPTDPRCPECGEPVSATASYCLHCYSDLPTAEGATSSTADASTAGDETTTTDGRTDFPTTRGEAADGTAFSTTAGEAATTEPEARTTRDGDGTAATDETGLLAPDGVVDDTATVVVALVLGTLSAITATLLLAFPLPGGLPFLGGLVTWIGVTAHAARSPTVFEATRRGCYAFAGLLVALPVVTALAAPMQTDTVGQRFLALVLSGLFVLPVAAVVAGIGYVAARADDE